MNKVGSKVRGARKAQKSGRTGSVANLLPNSPKTTKSKRPKRRMVAFETPDDVQQYISELRELGYTATGTCLMSIRLLRDMEQEMGAAFKAAQATANQEHISLGKHLGQLALQALEKRSKK